MAVVCFWVNPTDKGLWFLRRYTESRGAWTCEAGWHEAMVLVGEVSVVVDGEGYATSEPDAPTRHDDPRWPAECARGCGYRFTDDDQWQDFTHRLWRRADTGEVFALRDAPDGAMWDAFWLPWKGPDGRSIVVKCPGGSEWCVDSTASNCTSRPNGPNSFAIGDYDPDVSSGPEHHRCWIRHGEPPKLTVDKNGHTCSAGAGSIMAGDYHGFLRDGVFT